MHRQGLHTVQESTPQEQPKKPRLKPIDRKQLLLRPVDVERLIPDDHEVRAIWEFVGYLDLTPYERDIKVVDGKAGCPAFDPRLLISLWIYAYSKGVSSAREISRFCEYDPAYQWLTGIEPINYHTLADFRSTYGEALRHLFVEALCLTGEALVTLEQVMHDGTRIKASAGRDTFRGEKTIRKHRAHTEAHIRAMEAAPEDETAPRIQKAQERAVRERKERLSRALDQLAQIRSQKRSTQVRASTTDPECRIMGQADGGFVPGYNVQISTDAKNKVIIGVSASQSPADQTLLPSDEIEKTVDTLPRQRVVDAGFTTRDAIITAEERGVALIGSFPDACAGRITMLRRRGIAEAFYPEHFRFDPEKNVCICPEGKPLSPQGRSAERGKVTFHYRGKECVPPNPPAVPRRPKGAALSRTENDPRVAAFMERMETDRAKALYRRRGEVAEFPNAWIQDKFGLRQFRLRGLAKAGIEALWACFTYNIKIWVRLCWPKLVLSTVYCVGGKETKQRPWRGVIAQHEEQHVWRSPCLPGRNRVLTA